LIAVAAAVLKIFAGLVAAEGGAGCAGCAGGPARAARPDAGAVPDELGPNQVCLDGLRDRQVAFVEWPTRGVRTPVRILGPLGGVSLRSHEPRSAGKPALMDCELARALLEAGPAFRALGVRELLYSGTYQYRTRRRSTKLSEHAHGLAIDVHAFALDAAEGRAGARAPAGSGAGSGAVAGGAGAGAGGGGGGAGGTAAGPTVEVERDFETKVGNWPVAEQDECIGHPRTHVGRLLRTLACRLHASSIFREVIIPDDNADHYNHFHLEAFPDALTRTRAVLARKPTVTDD
jgi:hypothetical protein